MKTKDKEPYLECLTAFLKKKKLFCTPERFQILEECLKIKGHFTAEELQVHLSEGKHRISKATVYNTLPLLVESGILRSEVISGFITTYELRGEPHFHLVCRQCGAIKDVKDMELEAFMKDRRFRGFNAEEFQLRIHGLCSKCKRALKANKNK